MKSFSDFFHYYKFKNRATSDMKIYQSLSSLFLNDIGLKREDGQISTIIGIVSLHTTQKEHMGLHTLTKTILIVMVWALQTNYLGFL